MADVDLSIKATLANNVTADIQKQIREAISAVEKEEFKIQIKFNVESIQQVIKDLSSAMATIQKSISGGVSGTSSSASIKELTTATNDLVKATEKYNSVSKGSSGGSESSKVRASTTAYNQYTKALREATSMLEKYSAAKNSSSPETQAAYGNIETEIANLKSYYEKLQNGTITQEQFANSVKESQNAISQAAAQIQTTNDAYNQNAISAKEAAEAQKEIASAAQEAQSGLQAYASAQQSSNEAIQQAYSSYEEAANGMQQLSTAMSEGSIGTDEAREKMSAYQEQLDSAKTTLDVYIQEEELAAQAAKELAQSQRDGDSAMKSSANAIKNAENMLTRYSAAANSSSQETRSAYKGIEEELERLSNLQKQYANNEIGGTEFKTQVEQSQAQLKAYEQQIISTGDATKSLGDRFSNLASKFTMWFSASQAIMLAIRSIRQLISASIDLDSAMAQLKIVTDETDEAYAQFADDIAKTAQDIGASITDLVDSATTYARLGYNMEESSTLAEYTSMLKNVGDIEVDEAQEAVTSIVKAFDIGVDDIEQVMDKLVAVGNNYPISVSEIAEGMTNTSSTLAAAGNSLEESIALLTAANTTIQNVSRSSTGLRTIVARLRNTTTELDELGEDMTEAKYEELISALTDANVALTDQNGEYRSTYDIMKDIAHEWDDLTSMEQAALAQTIAGTRQQAVFYSLVEQFKEAENAMDTMSDSAGTLTNSYDIYMDTTQRHIESFQAAFQKLGSDLFQSDFLSGIVDLGAGIVNVIDKVVQLVNVLGGLKTVIAAVSVAIIALKWDSITTKITKMTEGIQLFGMQIQESVSKAVTQLKTFSSEILTTTQNTQLLTSQNLLSAFFTSFPTATLVAGIAGVTAGVIALVAALEYSNHAYTRSHEAFEQSYSDYQTEKEELESLQAELETTTERRDELLQLAAAGTISMDEEIELEALQSQTKELEQQVALKEKLAEKAHEVAAADAYDAATQQKSRLEYFESENDTGHPKMDKIRSFLGYWGESSAYAMGGGIGENPQTEFSNMDTSDLGLLKNYIQEVKNDQAELESLRAQIASDPTDEELQQQASNLESAILTNYGNISDYSELVEAQLDGLMNDDGTLYNYASGAADYVEEANKVLDDIITMDMTPKEKQRYHISDFFDTEDADGALRSIFEEAIADGADSAEELEGILESLGYSLEDIGDDVDGSALKEFFQDTTDSARVMEATVQESFNNMYNGLRDSLYDWYDTLSDADKELVYQIVLENDTSQWALKDFQDALAEYQEEAHLSFSIDIDAETTSLDNLNSALSESASSSGLTAEAIANLEDRYKDLDSYDPSKLFENTTEGVHLNKEALQDLEAEYDNLINKNLYDKLETEQEKYQEATEKLASLDSGTAEYYATLADVNAYETQIAETEQLISQYEGLTSAYGKWQDALSSTNENSEFEAIGSSYEDMQAILEQGWKGNDDLNAYLDLILGEVDGIGSRTGDVEADFAKLTQTIDGTNHSIMDYFTWEDGNLVTDGLYDFLDDVEAVFDSTYAWVDDAGYHFDFAGDRMQEVADRFGISVEFLEIMEKALSESGMDVEMGDGILAGVSSFEDLAQVAEESADTVNEAVSEITGEEFEVNFNADSAEEFDEQIGQCKEAYDELIDDDGEIDFNAPGADELAATIATLVKEKQELEESGNILLTMDAESCDDSIGKVISLIQEFQDQYDELEMDLALNADTSEAEANIQNIAAELSTLSDEDLKATLNLDDEGVQELRQSLAEITGEDWTVDASVNLDESALGTLESDIKGYKVDVGTTTADAEVSVSVDRSQVDSAIDEIKSDIESISTDPITITADTSQVTEAIDEINGEIANVSCDPISITAEGAEAISVISDIDKSNNIADKNFNIKANATQAESTITKIKNERIPDKSFTITAVDHASSVVSSIASSVNSLHDKTITVTTKNVSTNASQATGTANAKGTADARGDWSVGKSERALMGELGPEMVVRDGQYFTVGDNGAEFVDLQPDDIVFNHQQTEMLLNSGHIAGRGFVVGGAFAEGSAYDSGSGGSRRSSSSSGSSTSSTTTTKTTTTTTTKSSGSSSSSSSKSTSTSSSSKSSSSSSSSTKADDFEETMDWIEIKIDRIERAIDSLDLKMSSTYKTWSTRNSALSDELSKIADEITIQQQAYDRYIQQANSVGLSSSYAEKVRNGTIDISTITDEDLKDKIDEYSKW